MEKVTLYVSSNNNNSGLGTKESPFESLEFAKEYLDKHASEFSGDVELILNDGKYTLNEGLVFDSKYDGHFNLTIKALNSHKVIISGGKEFTKLSLDHDNVYSFKCDVKDVRNIFVNGERRNLACASQVDSYSQITGWIGDHYHVKVKKADLKGATHFESVFYLEWSESIVRIKDVKEVNDYEVELIPEYTENEYFIRHRFHPVQVSDHMLIKFRGAKEFLTDEGEFYFDSEAKKVFYIPFKNEDPSKLVVTIPTVDHLIHINGDIDHMVKNITVSGIDFEYSNFSGVMKTGFMELQAGHYCDDFHHANGEPVFNVPAAMIKVDCAEGIVLDDLHLSKSLGIGINFNYAVSNSKVTNCNISNTSATAIMNCPFITSVVQDDNLYIPADERINCHHNEFINNYIYYTGAEYSRSASLTNVLGHHCVITDNEISFGSYTGISNGWGWSKNDYIVSNNLICRNNIHHVGIRGSDLGGFYNLNAQRGTKVQYNYIHEINKGKNGFSIGSPSEGIYLDEGTDHLVVTHNQVAYAGEGGRLIYFNVAGDDNEIHDNNGLLCFDKLDKKIIDNSGVKNRELPYENNPKSISLGFRIGSFVKKDGEFGIRFKANKNLTVTGVGRFKLPGNCRMHEVTIYTDKLEKVASVVVDANKAMAKNGFVYASLDAPCKLEAGHIYYVLSKEELNGDYFSSYDAIEYFNDNVNFLCGVDIVGNIRKETNSYVGIDLIIK